MKRLLTPIIAVLLVLVLLFYMFTFQVRYDQVAVLTTFEAADAPVILTSTVRSVAALPADGVLKEDATFSLEVTSEAPVKVTVAAAATTDNASQAQPLEALRADVESAIAATPLKNRVATRLYGTRIILSLDSTVQSGGIESRKTLAVRSPNSTAKTLLFDEVVEKQGSLITESGLYFAVPWVQKVYTYSQRLQMLEDQLEEIQTSDEKVVILQTYITWRIEDPYAFFKRVNTIDRARKDLRAYLQDTKSVFSQFRFDEMVNTDPSKLKLQEIELRAAEQLRQKLEATDQPYGIRVEQVGIRRLLLPEQTTTKVFERMKTTRQRLAQEARSEGEGQATTIKASAESAKKRILAFADRVANKIRAEGDREAGEALIVFQKAPDLAIFLRQLKTAERAFAPNSQFILNADFPLADFILTEPRTDANGRIINQRTAGASDLKRD